MLTWGDGEEGPRTFLVPVLSDLLVEPLETVNLVLFDPMGGVTLGMPDNAVLTIADAPPAPPTSTAPAQARVIPAASIWTLSLMIASLAFASVLVLRPR